MSVASRLASALTLALFVGATSTGSTSAAGRAAALREASQAPGGEVRARPAEAGFPISDPLTQRVCSPCHKPDANQIMSRISFRRTTPEGWQQTVRRMVVLNHARLTPEEARAVVKFLANHLGLAPEEALPGAFEVERRLIDYKYEASRDTEQVCTKCHSMGRVILERRTKEEWELLVAMHRGFYPLVDFQAFRRVGPRPREGGPEGRPPDTRHPVEKALDHLVAAFPLRTPEWTAWSATMRPPKLAGRWALSGYALGQGPVYGEMVVRAKPDTDDEFDTETRLVIPRSGVVSHRRGQAIVYTGFQWRGRSLDEASRSTSDGPNLAELREVLFVDRDWRTMRGRWFTGAYHEIGLDVTLVRMGGEPLVLGVDVKALARGARGQRLRIYGANLPTALEPGAIDLGRGVSVARLVSASPEQIDIEVDVAADAPVGVRDLAVAGVVRPGAIVVFERVDRVVVRPAAGLARVGGIVFPKQYQQFEAVGFADGPDGKSGTQDDLELGLLDVAWSLEEYAAVFGDDDVRFVGTIDRHGLFTPNVDGPNPQRRHRANNVGDVWVVASYLPPGATRPIRGRAHLLVTVPLYLRLDMPEAGR
jgi:quinohemoprotein amine dehydrogenase